MTDIAFCFGSTVIRCSTALTALGVAACFALTCSLYLSRKGKPGALFLYIPLAILFSAVLSRLLHYYCHTEQYAGLARALTDYSSGGFVFSGCLAGTALAALLVRGVGLAGSAGLLLDCTAPGALIALFFMRLSCLFTGSCIGKIAVSDPAYRHLPLAYPFTNAAGGAEYRLATFFLEAILLVPLFLYICFFLGRNTSADRSGRPYVRRKGSTALICLTWYGALEMIADSTRFDSSFFTFNGFISVVQMFCAVSMLGVLVYFSLTIVNTRRRKTKRLWLCLLFLAALAVTGISEYMVQRHGDLYAYCYSAMSVGCFFMAFAVTRMYRLTVRTAVSPAPRDTDI